ncbi:MAG: LPXTG cell wall anchor domain-containing protein [Microbacterium sp.]|nr:MAG: LPXTG cell wall anchor domain-containing protein [Microbacterium sp.]
MKAGPLLLAVVLVSLALGASSAAAADEIGISEDGTSWGAGLDEPLFDPAVRWVPGDSRTESFFVRNQGPSGASMTIEARSADRDDLLEDDEIDLRARVAGGRWVELRNGVASTRLTDREIAEGGVVEVDVNARFDPSSTNQSQVKRLALDFRVRLSDAAGADGESDADADGGADADADADGSGVDADLDLPVAGVADGTLPDTGTTTDRWLLVIAGSLVLTGATLLARRRELEKEPS